MPRAADDKPRRPARGHAAGLLDDRHDPLSEDVFGHGDYAATLAEALQLAPDGMTVGLFGEWGIGKSSVLHALSAATPDTTAVVVFDAWRYGEDAFRREFLRDVAERLVEQGTLGRFDVQRDLADLDIDTATPQEFLRIGRPRVFVFLLSIALLFLAWLAVDGRLVETDAVGKAGLVTIVALVGLIIGRVEILTKVQTRTETHRRLEDADRFARRFRELLTAVKATHLVIAVDNVDRLEPDAAMEVLSTVKTYLEPAVERPAASHRDRILRRTPTKPKVNFVVAVDADALVAHLHDDNATTPDRPPDEFLRKFFAARITMRSLLDEDLDSFVRRRVEPLVDAWTPEPENADLQTAAAVWRARQIASLTDLIVAGVRRNPRRLKQFVNSIQMAMLMLETRHRQGLLPDLPTELDLVAVLVFIEEDCPSTFRHLVANPDLLDELHRAAQGTGSSPLMEQDEWRRLVPVLRSTYAADRRRARIYLRLKIPDAEQRLPDHDAIRAALRAGDVRDVALRVDPAAFLHGVVASVSEHDEPASTRPSTSGALWAAHLPELVRKELAGGRSDVVFNILRCLLEVDLLFRYEESTTATIRRAMGDPEIRAGAWRLPAAPLFQVVDRLKGDLRQAVFDALGRWYAAPFDATPEQLDAIAVGLAEREVPLTDPVIDGLRESLAAQPRLSQLDYAPIVRARPDIFPDAAIAPLLDLLAGALKLPVSVLAAPPQPDPRAARDARAQGLDAVATWLAGPGQTVLGALVAAGRVPLDAGTGDLLRSMLAKGEWEALTRDAVLHLIADAATHAPSVDQQVIADLIAATLPFVSQHPAPSSLLALAACVGRDEPPGRHRTLIADALRSMSFERLADAVRGADPDLTGPLRAALLAHAAADLVNSPNNEFAADIVARLDPEALLDDAPADAILESLGAWVDHPGHQDALIAAVGSDDRAAVAVDAVGLDAIQTLLPRSDEPDVFDATLALTVVAGRDDETTVTLDVAVSLLLRREPTYPDEVSVTLLAVTL